MSLTELKSRARELERAGKHDEACELLAKAAEENPDAGLGGALWTRVAAIRLASDDRAAAEASLGRAMDAFESAGQVNNALAAAQKLLDLAGDPLTVRVRSASLAIAGGYRTFARGAAMGAVADTDGANGGGIDRPLDVAAEFVLAFPEESDFLDEWVSEAAARFGTDATVDALRRLQSRASDPRYTALSAAIRRQIAGLAPSGAPVDEHVDDHLDDPGRDPWSSPEGEDHAEVDPSFITPGPVGPSADDQEVASRVAPIEGLEPTLVSLDDADDEADASGADDPIPFLSVPTDAGRSDHPEIAHDPDVADDPIDEPLPLLGSDDFGGVGSIGGEIAGASADGGGNAESPAATGTNGDAAHFDPIPLVDEPSEATADPDLEAVRRELASIPLRDIDPADPATHYDLGLAFKEMGLHDVALSQLVAAINGGFRLVASLEVMGEILHGRGDYELAERLLRPTTESDRTPDSERIGLLYWLSRSRESLGDVEDARRLLTRVVAVDADFLDAAQRLDALDTAAL